jgi:hypothetical protein
MKISKVGRKAEDGAKNLRHVTMTLDAATIRIFRAIGGGNVSAGGRKAANIIREAKELTTNDTERNQRRRHGIAAAGG